MNFPPLPTRSKRRRLGRRGLLACIVAAAFCACQLEDPNAPSDPMPPQSQRGYPESHPGPLLPLSTVLGEFRVASLDADGHVTAVDSAYRVVSVWHADSLLAYSLDGSGQGTWLQWRPASAEGPAGLHVLGTFRFGVTAWLDTARLWLPDDPATVGRWRCLNKDMAFAGVRNLTLEQPGGQADPGNPWQPETREFQLFQIRESEGDTVRTYGLVPGIGLLAFEDAIGGAVRRIAQSRDRRDYGKVRLDTLLR